MVLYIHQLISPFSNDRKEGMSLDEALAFLRKAKPNVMPNEAFMEQLKQYEIDCRKNEPTERSRRASKKATSPSNSKTGRKRIGPAMPPTAILGTDGDTKDPSDTASANKKARRSVIGPSLPPAATVALSSTTSTVPASDSEIGPSTDTKSTLIGPSLPPPPLTTTKAKGNGNDDDGHETKLKQAIGPSLPPTTG